MISDMLVPMVASALDAGFMYDLECGTKGFCSCDLDGPAIGTKGTLLAWPCPENRALGEAVLRFAT